MDRSDKTDFYFEEIFANVQVYPRPLESTFSKYVCVSAIIPAGLLGVLHSFLKPRVYSAAYGGFHGFAD